MKQAAVALVQCALLPTLGFLLAVTMAACYQPISL